MSGSRESLDKWAGLAVALLLAAPVQMLMVSQATKAVDFILDKSADQTIQTCSFSAILPRHLGRSAADRILHSLRRLF